MIIPFSNPLGPTNGPNSDGCVHSVLPYELPIGACTSTVALSVGNVFRGNADAAGGITYEDITSDLSGVGTSETTIFDTVNPTMDELWVEVESGDEIEGFGMYITTAGVYTGTATCEVRYKDTLNVWQSASCQISGQLDAVGMVYISFPAVLGGNLALQDALIDPVNNPQARRFLIKFNGITAVTTAPIVDMLIKTVSTEQFTDISNYIADDVANIPGSYDTLSLFTHSGDRSLFCFAKRFALMKIQIERGRTTSDANVIYSKSDGTYGTLSVLQMQSNDAARVGQWLTVDPGASPVEYVDIITPPDDWASQSITIGSSTYTGYFMGLEYTAGDSAPELSMLISLKAAEFTGSDGIEIKTAISAAKIAVNVRGTSDEDAVFAVINLTKGTTAILTLPALEYTAEISTSLVFSIGDRVAVQQLTGSETSVPSDGFISIN